jgi:hypothetical protein
MAIQTKSSVGSCPSVVSCPGVSCPGQLEISYFVVCLTEGSARTIANECSVNKTAVIRYHNLIRISRIYGFAMTFYGKAHYRLAVWSAVRGS